MRCESIIERLVIDTIYENLFTAGIIDGIAQKVYDYARAQHDEIPPYVVEIKKKLAATKKEIDNIVGAIAAGMFHPSMKEKMDVLEARKADLEISLEGAERRERMTDFSVEQIRTYLGRWSNLKDLSPQQQKQAVSRLTHKIIVGENEVSIEILTGAIIPDLNLEWWRRGDLHPRIERQPQRLLRA